MKDLGIVCAYDPKTAYGFSHHLVAREIQRAIKDDVKAPIHNFQERNIPERNLLFVGTCTGNVLTYLTRFLPERNVVLYATVEGFPIISPIGIEREVAKHIKIVAVSEYARLCIETSMLPCYGVVHHGIDMEDHGEASLFSEWIKSWTKGRPTVLYVSGNMERKGIYEYMLVSKIVQSQRDTCFILHSGGGQTNVRELSDRLQLEDFWYTNAFGLYPKEKMNSLYKLCDVYCQASLCEGFGIPMIEAMRHLRPVVAVDAQPYSEIVSDPDTGRLVPVVKVDGVNWMNQIQLNMHRYSVNKMASAIINLLEGKTAIKMKSNIAEARKRFDSANYRRLLSFFE